MMTGTPEHDPDGALGPLLRLGGPRERPSAPARARARAEAHEAWRTTVSQRSRRRWFMMLAPAVAAAVVILALVIPRTDEKTAAIPPLPVARLVHGSVSLADPSAASRPVPVGTALVSGTDLVTGSAEVATLSLTGGGELRINSGTRLQLRDQRAIRLDRGHIFVDSGDQKSPALAIDTPAGVVRDVGTQFDVRFTPGELRVRVRQGAVALDDGRHRVEAARGQQLVQRAGEAPVVSSTETFGADWGWLQKAAPFKVEGATLASYLAWIEREGGRPVDLSDPSLRPLAERTILHGSIEGLSLEESLDVMLTATGLSYVIHDNRIVIARSGRR